MLRVIRFRLGTGLVIVMGIRIQVRIGLHLDPDPGEVEGGLEGIGLKN